MKWRVFEHHSVVIAAIHTPPFLLLLQHDCRSQTDPECKHAVDVNEVLKVYCKSYKTKSANSIPT